MSRHTMNVFPVTRALSHGAAADDLPLNEWILAAYPRGCMQDGADWEVDMLPLTFTSLLIYWEEMTTKSQFVQQTFTSLSKYREEITAKSVSFL